MKHFFTLLLLTVIISITIHAQKDTVYVQGYYESGGSEGTLNNAIDAAISAGDISNTVFKLTPYELYVLTSMIEVPEGQHLEIVAPKPGSTQESAPPQIVWSASGGITTDYIIESFGNLTMKNIWIRYANINGSQVGSTITIRDQADPNVNETAYFEGCIFEYGVCPPSASGCVEVKADNFKGTFINCYFRNNADPHYRYYGRALSFPYQEEGWHTDEVLFENCTFANIGYVYMQEAGNYGDNVHFNHCTFLNSAMFTLQSGWWYKMYVTNSIHVNTFMYGNIPAQTGDGDPNGATIRIDPVDSLTFAVPFTDQDRRVLFAYNSHVNEPWLVDWMYSNPYSAWLRSQRRGDEVPIPQPFLSPETLTFFDSTNTDGSKAYPYINRAELFYDTDPGFVIAPTNLDDLKTFLQYKWDTNEDIDWSYRPDAGLNQEWPLPEDMSYINTTLKTAAMGGFPLGDLYNWWPNEYEQWAAQRDAEYDRIHTWLETGNDPLTSVEQPYELPVEFTLSQNYPNPFNPTTKVEYSIPATGHISLKVFNTLGQEIATLFDGIRNAGHYVATFDATGLASGVYVYRLQADNVTISRKFVLMK